VHYAQETNMGAVFVMWGHGPLREVFLNLKQF